MNRYVLRRILQAIPVLIGITMITFTFTELAPGDAVSSMLLSQQESGLTGELDVQTLREKYGLNQPPPDSLLAVDGRLGPRQPRGAYP